MSGAAVFRAFLKKIGWFFYLSFLLKAQYLCLPGCTVRISLKFLCLLRNLVQNRYGSVFKVNSYWVVIGHFCHSFDRRFLFAFQDLPKGFSWNFSGSWIIYKHQLRVWKSQSLKWRTQVLQFCFSGSSALSIYVLNFCRLLGYRRNNWCVWKSNTIWPFHPNVRQKRHDASSLSWPGFQKSSESLEYKKI